MTMTIQTVLCKRVGVVSRSLDDARIVLRLDRTETLVFNASADRLWDLFDGTRTLAQVAALSGQPAETIVTFAAQLVEFGLFEVAEPAQATMAETSPPVLMESPAGLQGVLEAPGLIAREELAVLGGCTSAGLVCSFPSSGTGGSSRAGRSGPPIR